MSKNCNYICGQIHVIVDAVIWQHKDNNYGAQFRFWWVKDETLRNLAYNTIVASFKLDGEGALIRSTSGLRDVYRDKQDSVAPMPEDALAAELNIDPKKFILLKPNNNQATTASALNDAEDISFSLMQRGIQSRILNDRLGNNTTPDGHPAVLVDIRQDKFAELIQSIAVKGAAASREITKQFETAARQLQSGHSLS